MNALIVWVLGHARTVLSILALALIAGLVSYNTISKESMPDVKIPIIFVNLHLEGASPEDAERLLLRPLEQKVRNIEGIKELRSTARQDGGDVVLEFTAGFNSDKAMADVRVKVDEAKAELPGEADEPVINEVNLSLFPVLVINLSGDIPQRTLYRLAKELQDGIEAGVSSVLEVKVVGDREEVVEIVIDPLKLEGYQLSFEETVNQIQQNNKLISAGGLDTGTGSLTIKVPGLIETAEEIVNFPLRSEGDAVVTVGDVANVRRTFKDSTGAAREWGRQTVALEVVKRTGENIIDTLANVRSVVDETRTTWPETVQISYSQDESERIVDMLEDLQNNIIAAVLLVMVVIVLSLGWRSALIVGLAIPGSFLMGILTLKLMGLTVNTVVLFSLILSVGMLVDGAIIVVEYADRKMAEGLGRFDAYASGAKRMAWPVITSISTILVVFLPLLFWPGIVGQFMRFLPITLLATLTASILMAIIFIPTIGSLVGKLSESDKEAQRSIAASEIGDLHEIKGMARTYVNILEHALNMPGRIIAGAVGLLVVIIFLYGFLGKGVEFFPDLEPNNAVLKIQGRGNLSDEERDTLVKRVENRLLDMEEFSSIYTNSDSRQLQGAGQDTIGFITLEFVDWQKRRTADEILKEVEERAAEIPGIVAEIKRNKPGPKGEKPIDLEISGPDVALLDQTALYLRTHFETVEGLTAIEDNRSIPGIDWEVKVNRSQAAKFGANIALIGNTIKLITNGIILDQFRPDDSRDEIDIIVRFPAQYRTLDQLQKIRVQTKQGLVPISTFVTVTPKNKVAAIYRIDGKRTYSVKADVKPGVLVDTKVQELKAWLETARANAKIDPTVKITFTGEEEEKSETSAFLMSAFGIAIFSIAIILITQFNSFFSMGLILSSVVMSTIGVFMGLIIMRQPFGIVMTGLGVIALSGIIVSNNIILLDTFDHLKGRIKDVREVILRTGAQRLRPVILTKLTTILGLLPIVFGLNINFMDAEITHGAPSGQWWIQLSTAIVFGVLFASVLTLILTPCALMARENVRSWYLAQKHPLWKTAWEKSLSWPLKWLKKQRS